ncbi:hypothetical protein [Clostridium facile]|uniref:Uncharacterized protein n=1 Tax=Clostridium facile TaxID=2763035 RepID=A0ABR7IST1_9CLOT|nr:hypothetical protein [Clostridium facile]MBC5788205.1 hypothetical protein [Clostridium facile]
MKQFLSSVCLLLAACILLIGCSEQKQQEPTEINADAQLDYTDVADFSNYPDYIRKQYDNRTFLDMEVAVPTPKQFNTYTATLQIPDVQLWLDVFYSGHKNIVEDLPPSGSIVAQPDTDKAYKNTKTGSNIKISREFPSYYASDNEGYGGPYGFLMRANGALYPPISEYASDQELKSISKEEAIKQVDGIIEKLGLQVDQPPQVYALPYEQMRQVAGMSAGYGSIQEGYFIVYRCSLDDVPIFADYHAKTEIEDLIAGYGSAVSAIVTKDGLRQWDAFAFYDTQLQQENVSIISLQTVLDSVSQRLAKAFEERKSLINRAELCYFPIADQQYDLEVTLQPVWVVDTFSIASDDISLENLEKFSKGQHVRYFIDATTGNYIITGDVTRDPV